MIKLRRFALVILGWLAAIVTHHAAPVAAVPPPAGPGAMGSALTLTPEGQPLLSWLEPAADNAWAMKWSAFDVVHHAWRPARTVAQGAGFFTNWADFPQLAAQTGGRLTAIWSVNNPEHHAAAASGGHHGPGYRAIYSLSGESAKDWTPELPVSDESLAVEFVTVLPLRDGRVLAAWLDGRHRGRMALYGRVLDGRPGPGPDVLIDDSVCDCCQLSLVPSGEGALLAYRGRTAGEIRDIQLARFDGQAWAKLGPLHADNWKIAGCPVNGPRLATRESRVGAVWFTAASEQARVFARLSTDAGKTFGPVQRVDLGRPQGRVDGAMLADGTFAVTWLEMTGAEDGKEGGIYVRTLSPAGELSAPRLVAATKTSRVSGFPRIVPIGNRELLLTCTQDSEPTRVLAFFVELD